MKKDDQTRLGFLVDEEHAHAEPVRRGLDARPGVHILWHISVEVLVRGDELAGREPLAGAGLYH